MRLKVLVVVVVLCVCRPALAVQVRVGDQSFPLEAVKQLKELMGSSSHVSPHLANTSPAAICMDPLLPQLFRPVCERREAAIVFSRLVSIITPTDPCEICADPACFGCRI